MGAIENKCVTTQSDRDIIDQLKANMLLSVMIRFLNEVVKEEFDSENIRTLKCYGIALPLLSPLTILSLTVDFSKRTLTYETRFQIAYPPLIHVYADGAIEYILNQVAVN